MRQAMDLAESDRIHEGAELHDLPMCRAMIVMHDEIERLNAALRRIARDELAEAWNADSAGGGPEGWENDYWRVVNIARSAVQPEKSK